MVVGGGHNGLTAAAYLARAGRSVLVLERADHLGGATGSLRVFRGVDANLSRYSYLVSLMPQAVRDELGLSLQVSGGGGSPPTRPCPAMPRADCSSTPGTTVRPGARSQPSAQPPTIGPCRDSPRGRTPSRRQCSPASPRRCRQPPGCGPLSGRSGGPTCTRRWASSSRGTFTSDLVRGVIVTDALIGTFADAHDTTLVQNRCFLYHVIGGDGRLGCARRRHGCRGRRPHGRCPRRWCGTPTRATVRAVHPGPDGADVAWTRRRRP